MFDVGTFTYNLLITEATITSLVPVDSIFSVWPETITVFPSIVFDDTQYDINYKDNLPAGSYAVVTIDVFVKDTPTPIAIAICDAFKKMYWSCEFNKLVPDPDTSVRHRNMRFSRPLPSDIV